VSVRLRRTAGPVWQPVSMKSAIGRVTRERHRGNAFAARSTAITVCDRSPGLLSVARTLVI
jgi:hypothetical protein